MAASGNQNDSFQTEAIDAAMKYLQENNIEDMRISSIEHVTDDREYYAISLADPKKAINLGEERYVYLNDDVVRLNVGRDFIERFYVV